MSSKSTYPVSREIPSGLRFPSGANPSVRVTRNVFHRALLASFGAAALSLAAVHAQADEQADELAVKTVVRYTDLDLSKPEDARVLYVRLQSAAHRVCGDTKGYRDLRVQRVQQACYEKSLARAVDDIGHSAVKALYAADDDIRIAAKRVDSQPRT